MIQLTKHRPLGGNRGYDSVEERDADIERLKAEGYDHFTFYRDAKAPIAVSYGKRVKSDQPTKPAIQPWCPKPGDRGYDLLC